MGKRQKLVVIGNGMAGARVVEEVLARGGDRQFEITMFGEEPYGNYNRILLSDVLNGSHDASEIFLNPLRHQAARRRESRKDSSPPAHGRRQRWCARTLRSADHRDR